MSQGDKKELSVWDFKQSTPQPATQAYTSRGEESSSESLTWDNNTEVYMTRMSPGLDRWRWENLDHYGTESWRQSFRNAPDRFSKQLCRLAALGDHRRSENDARKERETVTRRTTYLERDPRRNRNLPRRDVTSENCQWMDKSIISSGPGCLSECKDAPASSVDERSEIRKVTDKEQEGAKKPGESSLMERSNDAKAMSAFKVQVVDFVKVLLGPTWKEGHLSKEAYKEIVKKVADKVVATIEKPKIPRTRQKIDQFLSLSKPKISKLVQAYVENCRRSETRS